MYAIRSYYAEFDTEEEKESIGKHGVCQTSEYAVKIAAEVKDFEPDAFFDKKAAKHLDLFVQYGLAAAQMAMQDSGVEVTDSYNFV